MTATNPSLLNLNPPERLLGTALLGVFGLAGNWLSLSLFFGLDLIFGSVAVMLAVAWLGLVPGIVVALIAGSYTFILWGHPYAMLTFTIEALIVGWFYHRLGWKNLVLADLVFWLTLGIPMVLLLYTGVLDMAWTAVALIAVKQAINGLLNTVLAGLIILVLYFSARTYRVQRGSLDLKWILFHGVLTLILISGMTPVIWEAGNQSNRYEAHSAETLQRATNTLVERLEQDLNGSERVDYHLDRVRQTFPEVFLALGASRSPLAVADGTVEGDFYLESASSGLGVWLPSSVSSAMVAWRGGYYRLERPGTDSTPTIVAEVSALPVVKAMESYRLTLFSLIGVILLAGIASAFVFSRLIASPLKALETGSYALKHRILKGELQEVARSPVREFDEVALALNELGSELVASVRVLEESRGELSASLAEGTRELARAHELLSSVMAAAEGFSIIATDIEGRITLFNQGAVRMLGYSPGEVTGRETPALFHLDQEVAERGGALSRQYGTPVEGFRVFVHEAELGKREAIEWTYVRKDGSRLPVALVVTVIRDNDGVINGYLGIAEDISERKRLERIKSEFVSTVSHELRTPLTSISGALGMLKAGVFGELSGDAKRMVELADANSLRLSRLINDLLDMDKVTEGKLHFDIESLELDELLYQSIEAVSAFAAKSGVTVRLSTPRPGLQVRVDRYRFQQIMDNLLSNAIKFSPEHGDVEVVSTLLNDRVRVSIKDQGPGVPEEFRGRIFGKFAQADSSDRREKGGTGLGLAITRELVERMGGKVGFDTEPGQGATFWFDLPYFERPPEQTAFVDSPASYSSLLILAPDLQKVKSLKQVIEGAGYDVDVFDSADTALEAAKSARYRAIIVQADEYDSAVIGRLKELRCASEQRLTPVLVIKGWKQDGHFELLRAGMGLDVLIKPVRPDELIQTIRTLGPQDTLRLKALHIEDDEDFHQVLKAIAGDAADVNLATTMSSARHQLSQGQFDVVILDLGLPDGSGADLIPDIRTLQPSGKILVLSGNHVDSGVRYSVEQVLTKSQVTADELIETIRSMAGASIFEQE